MRPSPRRIRPRRTMPPLSGGCTPTSPGICRPGASTKRRGSTCDARSRRRRRDSARTIHTSPPLVTTSRSSTACRGDGTRRRGCTKTRRGRWSGTSARRTRRRPRRCTTSGDVNSRGATFEARTPRTRRRRRRKPTRSAPRTRTTRRRCSTWPRPSARGASTRRARRCWNAASGCWTSAAGATTRRTCVGSSGWRRSAATCSGTTSRPSVCVPGCWRRGRVRAGRTGTTSPVSGGSSGIWRCRSEEPP
mmetsp:Transcript_4208/g.17301  ORF Transcript_4208/g.17301 Transcript_4208/m.17301 type:complete len:248 (+) Transcript_4208:199-942(+)